MVRKRVRLERIADEKLRQATFVKKKNGLLKKAMELSITCDCDVAVIIFGPGTKKLVQYSSTEMENILERYSMACQQPHERRTNDELFKLYYPESIGGEEEDEAGDGDADGKGEARSKKRPRSIEEMTRRVLRPGSPTLSDGSVSSLSEGSLLGTGAADVLKPLGLAIDRRVFPVSPKSERAFEAITIEFDKLLEQMRQIQEHANTEGDSKQATPAAANGGTAPPGASSNHRPAESPAPAAAPHGPTAVQSALSQPMSVTTSAPQTLPAVGVANTIPSHPSSLGPPASISLPSVRPQNYLQPLQHPLPRPPLLGQQVPGGPRPSLQSISHVVGTSQPQTISAAGVGQGMNGVVRIPVAAASPTAGAPITATVVLHPPTSAATRPISTVSLPSVSLGMPAADRPLGMPAADRRMDSASAPVLSQHLGTLGPAAVSAGVQSRSAQPPQT